MLTHQVEILYDVEGSGHLNPVCTGTIISAYFVLTVASCLTGKNEAAFKIRANGTNQNIQMRTIDRVHSYAAVYSETSPFDVALIRLNSKLNLLHRVLSYLPYHKTQTSVPPNLVCKASVSGEQSSSVWTVAPSECSERNGDQNAVCTKLAAGKPSGTQLPLTGSALVCSDRLYGVLAMNSSTDKQDGGKRVYTNVAKYANWIRIALEEDEIEAGAIDYTETSFGANPVDPNNPVPYQLSIQHYGRHTCGAVILDKKTALTAAHCLKFNPNQYKVVAGKQNLTETGSTVQVLEIDNVFIHPKYQSVIGGNDIAVIRVKGEFNFTDRVNNVWISSPATPDFPAFKGAVTGWGKATNGGRPSNVLQEIQLDFFDRDECGKRWAFLKPSMVCGYDQNANACEGDSGGPFVLKNYTGNDLLVGITSFAPTECDKQHEPNGFTNVSYYYDWIAEKRSNSLCSSSQFQCFNGECIDEELKCDKKYDCEDGSDEKICESYTRVTHDCGGLIKLANSHEIQWRAPSSSPHPNSSCLWIIANPHADRPTNTEIKIVNTLSYRFDSASSQLYVVRNLTGNQLATSLLNQVETAFNFSEPFLMLHFHTNSTARSTGIHLKITDKSDSSDYIAKQAQGLDLRADLDRNTNQSFSHVYSGSHCRSKVKSRNIFKNAPLQNSSDSQNPPYMLNIQLDEETLCTGVILDKKTALSTASCFDWRELDAIRVVAGETNLSRTDPTEQILEIEKIVKHGKWRYPKFSKGNDIALIHVKGEFNFSEHVNNIWISSPETLNLEGVSGSVAAWIATTRQGGEYEPTLQNITMEMQSDSDCKKTYPFFKNSKMMCAFRNGTNVCGMTGAPFVLKNQHFGQISRDILVGISTFGPKTCESITRPVAFTRVDHFYDWIERNRGNSSCSSSQFQCYNGQCISSELKCNYVFDCSDGSDETVCTAAGATTVKTLDSCVRRPGNETTVENNNNVSVEEENLFLFLKPVANGGRIQVDIDSLQLAAAQDSLEIISYRQNTKEITRLNSVRGAGSWSDKIYYGDENESILVYFHARPSSFENQKINLNYFERPRVTQLANCGGVLDLEDELEIVYQIPEESRNFLESPETNCEWEIRNSNGSSIEATLFHNPSAHFDATTSSLSAVGNSALSAAIKLDQKYVTQNVYLPSMNLTFRSKSGEPNTGFHLHLKNVDSEE